MKKYSQGNSNPYLDTSYKLFLAVLTINMTPLISSIDDFLLNSSEKDIKQPLQGSNSLYPMVKRCKPEDRRPPYAQSFIPQPL
jgi:hypothetical protein